ncbi:MAG: trypsin-like peptidase domain-containing protein [Isosphaeraceae bacterium]
MTPKRLSLGLLFLACVTSDASAAAPEESVVRVFSSMRLPHPTRPWAKQNPVEVMGTGAVIDGKRILTNAHIVLYAGEVFVQGQKGGDRFVAKVAAIGPGIDLAVLTLEDETFFEKRPALPRAARRPGPGDAVVLMGFPAGGTGLAISPGQVSRIDYAAYNDLTEGMRIQVNAVAAPGNSGGPALVSGKMIGLVFRRAQNAGLIIPNEEIDAFLTDVKDGRYDGKPRSVDHFQTLVNETLRKKLGLKRSDRGILVRQPGRTVAGNPLRENDVVTRIGTAEIDNEGLVDFEGLRLPFSVLVPRLAKNGTVPVRLIRGGKPLEVGMVVTCEDDRLIRPYRGQYPRYFVHGPLVFSTVIDEAVSTYAQGNPYGMLGSPLLARDGDRVAFPGEELVVVTAPMLAHPMTCGYADPFGQVVKDIDGVPIKNLRHLVEVLREGKGEFVTIRFHGELAETLVFPRETMEAATSDLMAENGIPRRGSEDVMRVWGGKPTTAR